jgi:hypothetical protein
LLQAAICNAGRLRAAIVRLVHSSMESEMSDVADLSVQDCARILLHRPGLAGRRRQAVTLANVRTALARLIYALGGQGFPTPLRTRWSRPAEI